MRPAREPAVSHIPVVFPSRMRYKRLNTEGPMLQRVLLFLGSAFLVSAQTPPPFIALGDSLGEGVQSAIASDRTQPHVYLNLVAQQMKVAFPLPLLSTTFYGVIGSGSGR